MVVMIGKSHLAVISWAGIRKSKMPRSAKALYFSISARNPEPLVCRPFVHTDPSTSMATPDSCHQSIRHLRVGWKRYSGISLGPFRTRQRISNLLNSASPISRGYRIATGPLCFRRSSCPADPVPRPPSDKTCAAHIPVAQDICKSPWPRNTKTGKGKLKEPRS